MEHVPGRTLAALLAEGPLEAATVLRLVRQVAEALADAHEHGIVHRDVKPGNVMVTERGHVKVLDFGLARFAPPGAEDSATWSGRHGRSTGRSRAPSPTCRPSRRAARPVDPRSDVFSLGVVLYEMLAGRRPFGGPNAVALVDAILREPPSALRVAGAARRRARRARAAHAGEGARTSARRHARGLRRARRDLGGAARGAPRAGEPAVAVVAFANITGRPEDAWLGTGLAETVAAGLAGLPGVAVVARERIVEVMRALGIAAEADDMRPPCASAARSAHASW